MFSCTAPHDDSNKMSRLLSVFKDLMSMRRLGRGGA